MDSSKQNNKKETEYIITVDAQDRENGHMEKYDVHKQGILHRAFSLMIFNDKGEVLLQKRAKGKYHSPGLWSNACCSHQRVGETLIEAVGRRIQEELGFTCQYKEVFKFIYQVKFDNGLMEYEIDHVFFGYYNGTVIPNKEEVEEFRWVDWDSLNKEMKEYPEKFTYWFLALMEQPEMLSKDKLLSGVK